jgi:hypothetical protein
MLFIKNEEIPGTVQFKEKYKKIDYYIDIKHKRVDK